MLAGTEGGWQMSSYDSWRTRSDRDEDERFGRTPEPEPEEE
jgi:hypothetical protein